MKLLLDTHAFLWLNGDVGRLSETVRALCATEGNEFYLSIASAWEMQIKAQLGKLALSVPIVQMVDRNGQINGIQLLPITLGDIGELENLPTHHKDPFDRIMIAQAIRGNLSIISVDHVFSDYPVAVIW